MLLKAPWQWVASPLSFNLLLSVLKENSLTVEKYIQIAKQLESRKECTVKNKVYCSSSHTSFKINNLQNLTKFIEVEEADFSKNGNTFTNYVNKCGLLRYHEFSSKTDLILANITLFESGWQSRGKSGPVMKLYNSFNYTQDIKYEGKMAEIPLCSDMKLVLILPNEENLLQPLFFKLTNRGLAAAVNSIQPLFTANSEFSAPKIDIQSRIEIIENISGLSNASVVQYGCVLVTNGGTQARVLTCIYSPPEHIRLHKTDKHVKQKPDSVLSPLYYAVVFEDTPIFYGNFKV